MKARILVVDDDPVILDLLSEMLKAGGHQPSGVDCAAALQKAFEGPPPELVLLDLQLPDADGLELLPTIKRHWPETEVIMLTGHATFDVAVEATKRGAFHFQPKPFETKSLLILVERALEHKRLREEAMSLRQALSTLSGGTSPIFQSAAMKAVIRTVERVAPSDVSVLITGESGTGKEVVTDLIHSLSPRAAGPLIKVNCAALPRELIESELFGSVKGAFTGANADREGLFRLAENGTLMLDELAEMPVDTQSKLLRVLQEKEARPVGGRSTYRTNCRVIAATNRKTELAIREGKLREDLFYRISAITIDLPPLRDRRDDIVPLANSFLKKFAAQAGRALTGFSTAATDLLRGFDWPGNVRQLQNEIQRAVLLCDGPVVEAKDLSITPAASAEAAMSDLPLIDAMERNAIVQVLKELDGNKMAAAKRLGIGRQTLYNKLKEYGIEA